MCMSHYRLFIFLVINCGDPGTPSNGSRNGSVFTFGGTVRYRCNHGYKLSGSSNRTCEASGRWSGNQTDCKGRTMHSIYIISGLKICSGIQCLIPQKVLVPKVYSLIFAH